MAAGCFQEQWTVAYEHAAALGPGTGLPPLLPWVHPSAARESRLIHSVEFS